MGMAELGLISCFITEAQAMKMREETSQEHDGKFRPRHAGSGLILLKLVSSNSFRQKEVSKKKHKAKQST